MIPYFHKKWFAGVQCSRETDVMGSKAERLVWFDLEVHVQSQTCIKFAYARIRKRNTRKESSAFWVSGNEATSIARHFLPSSVSVLSYDYVASIKAIIFMLLHAEISLSIL